MQKTIIIDYQKFHNDPIYYAGTMLLVERHKMIYGHADFEFDFGKTITLRELLK